MGLESAYGRVVCASDYAGLELVDSSHVRHAAPESSGRRLDVDDAGQHLRPFLKRRAILLS